MFFYFRNYSPIDKLGKSKPKDKIVHPMRADSKTFNTNDYEFRRPSKTDLSTAEKELDELLSSLTTEELDKLNSEVDPEDTYLPARDRNKNQTDKAPTGKFDRIKLLNFLEEKARNEKDWPNMKPFKKETRGTVWKPKENEMIQKNDEVNKCLEKEFDITTAEWDDVIKHAAEPELVELAAILGMTGLVTQSEYHSINVKKQSLDHSEWSATVKAEALKYFPPEPDNDTDVEQVIKDAKQNSEQMTSINLNNMKDLEHDKLIEVINALKDNTVVHTLYMCNVAMNNQVGEIICELLEQNNTLVSVNLESNRFTGDMIVKIVKSTLKNQVVRDLRLENQRAQVLGHKYENEIADYMEENTALLRLGLHFDCYRPRVVISYCLKRNMDLVRQERQVKQSNSDHSIPVE
ncbi:hypothetical protein GJ496_002226 [Pomphorhynchus laevis]|nr:hypothetical protein GJ496_002226 [Pomphorhynchus laevis]